MAEMLKNLPVLKKLYVLGAFFVLSFAGTVLYTVTTLEQQESDANIINIAGRERMLTQKFSKEVMHQIYQRQVAFSATGSDTTLATNGLQQHADHEKTTTLFEISLKALREGGKTYSDLDMTRAVMLPANEDPEVEQKLAEVAEVWHQLRQAVDISRQEQVNSASFLQQVQLIRVLNIDVLGTMHTAVNMMAENSRNKIYAMENTEWLILLFTILLGGWFCVRVGRGIVYPLQKAVAVVGDFSDGNLNQRIKVSSSDEIGQLATAFNRMADSIQHYTDQITEKNSQLKAYGDELEQRVRERTATLAAANEEVKSFAYIVSHDLRSPLVNMKGFTGELDYTLKEVCAIIASIQSSLTEDERQQIQQLIEEDIPESIQFITSSVEKMDHMLSAILNLSRLGRRELNIEPVDLHALSSDIISSLAYQIEQRCTKVILGDLPVIDNDCLIMQQMMGNLIGNAVKYLDPERPGNIRVSSTQSASGISISVRDNGRGILPQEMEKVFQIFRRGIHQDVEGEGMGLPYVQTLVHAQGGSISFEPAPDCGTIFTIFLPNR